MAEASPKDKRTHTDVQTVHCEHSSRIIRMQCRAMKIPLASVSEVLAFNTHTFHLPRLGELWRRYSSSDCGQFNAVRLIQFAWCSSFDAFGPLQFVSCRSSDAVPALQLAHYSSMYFDAVCGTEVWRAPVQSTDSDHSLRWMGSG